MYISENIVNAVKQANLVEDEKPKVPTKPKRAKVNVADAVSNYKMEDGKPVTLDTNVLNGRTQDEIESLIVGIAKCDDVKKRYRMLNELLIKTRLVNTEIQRHKFYVDEHDKTISFLDSHGAVYTHLNDDKIEIPLLLESVHKLYEKYN